MIPVYAFTYAAEHLPGLLTGDIVRYGAILKSVATGRIVGHLQETGAFQTVLSGAMTLSPPPFNALFMGLNLASGLVGAGASAFGVYQNTRILNKLAEIEQAISLVQALGAVTLVSSVAGLGATVIGTAVLMRRIDGVSDRVRALGDRIEALPEVLRADGLTDTLDKIRHEISRLSEIESRPETGQRVAEVAEANLDECFRVLARAVRQTAASPVIDPDLLRPILAGMIATSDAVATVRLRFDGPLAAQIAAERHYAEFESAVGGLFPDVIRARLPGVVPAAERSRIVASLVADMREIRARLASRPALHETLVHRGISGPDYIQRVAAEQDEPFLLLSTGSTG